MKDYSCSFVDSDVATEDKYKEVEVELPKKKQKTKLEDLAKESFGMVCRMIKLTC